MFSPHLYCETNWLTLTHLNSNTYIIPIISWSDKTSKAQLLRRVSLCFKKCLSLISWLVKKQRKSLKTEICSNGLNCISLMSCLNTAIQRLIRSQAALCEWFDLVQGAIGKHSSCEVLYIQWLASIPRAEAAAIAAADIVRSCDNLPVIELAVFRCVVIHWTSEIKDYKPLWATGQTKEAGRVEEKTRPGNGHGTQFPTRQRRKCEDMCHWYFD